MAVPDLSLVRAVQVGVEVAVARHAKAVRNLRAALPKMIGNPIPCLGTVRAEGAPAVAADRDQPVLSLVSVSRGQMLATAGAVVSFHD